MTKACSHAREVERHFPAHRQGVIRDLGRAFVQISATAGLVPGGVAGAAVDDLGAKALIPPTPAPYPRLMFSSLLARHPLILAECAVAERLRRLPGVELHPTLYNSPLVYGPSRSREAMASIYLEYIATARKAGVPILLSAPTCGSMPRAWPLPECRPPSTPMPSPS
ncbi:MAG: hypothetical protein IPM40_21585 [Gammaproteobacteria bacterium]|nr:hypothetical protein [Gammaproteobacteria bacterium]